MDERREHIVSATISCMQKHGLSNTSLSDVCGEAEISRGALYIHFASKDDILDAVIRRQSAQLLDRLAFDSEASLRTALKAQVRIVSSAQVKASGHLELELLIASRTNKRLQAELSRAMNSRSQLLKTGLGKLAASGKLKPGVDVAAAAHAIDSFLLGLFTAAVMSDETVATRLAALDLVLAAIFKSAK